MPLAARGPAVPAPSAAPPPRRLATGALVALLLAGPTSAQSPPPAVAGGPRVVPADGSSPEAALGAPVVRTVVPLPEAGLEVVDERRVLPDGRVARTTTLPDGTPVDLGALRRADHALGLRRRGGMTPRLAARVGELATGETLEVAFWLAEPGGTRSGGDALRAAMAERASAPDADVGAVVDAARREAHAAAARRHAAGNAAFAGLAASLGAEVLVTGDAWPFVVARVDAAAARALARDPAVDEAYLSQPEWFPEGGFAQGTLRTPTVWAQGVLAGSGVDVLVNDTAQVQLDNPWLPPVVALNAGSAASHATGVAGNIANTHPDHKAASYTIDRLFSAGGSGDVAAPAIWNLAITEGVDYGNCSWWNGLKGSIAFLDRFFDHTIRNFGVMMFKSTGNQGTTSAPYTTTPGNGYNMTNSGAYTDLDDVAWAGDAMASTSSYWDPVEGHEKPELASPGTGVTTTGTGPGGLQSGFGGTSSASPLTCGVAALLGAGEPTLLTQMTTVKAALMASAWHNVEGDPLLSERDGAGGVHAAAAWALVREGRWWHDEVVAGDFAGGVLDVAVPALAGEDVRVVALWFSNPDSAYTTDVLDMELDLTVLTPGGAVAASSASASNPFEIATFRATVTGPHVVRLTLQRFDGVSEPLTVAWSTRSDTAVAEVGLAPGSAPFAAGELPTLGFSEPYEGAGKPYAAWAALAPAAGFPFGGSGFTLPTSYDWFAQATVFLPGFVGTLDGSGRAEASLPVPDVPQAVGVPLHLGLVVLEPSASLDDVATVGRPTTLVIQP